MNSTALAASEPNVGAGPVHSYPETRIGAFDFYVATCTEPLWYGSADGQRACGDSWREVTEDLFLFIQEDPAGQQSTWSPYAYVENRPLAFRDPSGALKESFTLEPTIFGTWKAVIGQICHGEAGCLSADPGVDCTCKECGGNWRLDIELNFVAQMYISTNRPDRGGVSGITAHENGHLAFFRASYNVVRRIAREYDGRLFGSRTICKLSCGQFYRDYGAVWLGDAAFNNAWDFGRWILRYD